MSESKKLNEKELESVNGGLYRRLPTSKSVSSVATAHSLGEDFIAEPSQIKRGGAIYNLSNIPNPDKIFGNQSASGIESEDDAGIGGGR